MHDSLHLVARFSYHPFACTVHKAHAAAAAAAHPVHKGWRMSHRTRTPYSHHRCTCHPFRRHARPNFNCAFPQPRLCWPYAAPFCARPFASPTPGGQGHCWSPDRLSSHQGCCPLSPCCGDVPAPWALRLLLAAATFAAWRLPGHPTRQTVGGSKGVHCWLMTRPCAVHATPTTHSCVWFACCPLTQLSEHCCAALSLLLCNFDLNLIFVLLHP